MSGIFEGKVALVTGAARGIGAATAAMFARHGARVVLADRLDAVTALAEDLGAGMARSLVGSVADASYCEQLVSLALSDFGRLDFAFNNAGISGKSEPIEQVTPADWRRVIEVNLSAVFYGIKYQVPAMVAGGGGVIVNTASVLGLKPLPSTSLEYTAAKHGVIGLTRQLAVNYGGEGIRCVAVCPGFIETALTRDEEAGWFLARTPAGRAGQPEDIAGVVKMLCSEDASFINGASLQVDGGFVMT